MLNIKRFLGMWVGVVVVSLACYGESAAQAGEATFVAVQLSPTDGVVFLEYTSTGQETVLGSLPQHISFADLDPTAEWLIPTRYHLSLASDGEQVAFVAEGDDESALFLFSLADNQLQQIPLALSAWSPEWSPDNEAILLRPRGYLVEDAYPEVYIYDIGTDTLSQITDTPDYWESLLLWHPSGDYVIFDSPCQEPCTYGIEDIYLTDRFGNIQVLTNLDSQLPDFVETYHNICFLAFNPYDQRIYYEIGCLRPGDGAQDLLFSTDLQGDNRLEIDLFEVYNDVFYSVRNIQGIEFLETGVILAVELWDIVPLHWSVAQLSAPGVLEPVLAVEFSNVYADQLLYGLNFSPDRNRFALRGFSPDDMYTLNVIEFDEGQLADLNDEQVVARHFEPEFFEICAVRWLDNQTVAFQVEQYGCGREVQSLNLLDVPTGEVTNLSQEVDGTLLFAPRTVGVKPPTADAGPDQTLTDSDDDGSELVTLDGSGSSDPDGTIESYVWTENDVEIATGVSPQVNLSVGVHTITLTVTDDDGATDTDEVVITVNPPATASTLTVQVGQSSDDVNEEGVDYEAGASSVWLGTGGSVADSYTGLRFSNLAIPPGVTITSAYVEVYTPSNAWIGMEFSIAAEAVDDSAPFSPSSRPSQRVLTSASVNHSSDDLWPAQTWQALDEMAAVVQEVVDRPGWQSGNSLSVILQGTGGQWGRKFVTSYDGDPAYAPRLVVEYTTQSGGPTATPVPDIIPPTADAGSDQTLTYSNDDGSELVTLDGSGSSDPDGTITD